MDKTLKLKFHEFLKTLLALEDSLRQKPSSYMRDSIIKRFEFTFELCWKVGKILLSKEFGIEVFSPKEAFRELRKLKLMTDKNTEKALEMTDERNNIVHRYDLQYSRSLSKRVRHEYFHLLQGIKDAYKKFCV